MISVFKERVRRVLGRDDKLVTGRKGADIGPVDKEKLWTDMAQCMLTCLKSGGFYYEIQETPPPFADVMFGIHCEVAVRDETGDGYEVGLVRFHWPGDKGESQLLQVSQIGYRSHTFVTVQFRSDVNVIRLSPDSAVKRSKWISSSIELDSRGELDLLSRLSRVVIDEHRTLELFDERREKDGRSVAWIRDMPLLPDILGQDGGL